MPGWLDRLWRRWEDRAAVRLEHHVEPGLRRRLDRLPGRVRGRLELRAERRARYHDVGEKIARGAGRGFGDLSWTPRERRRW